MRTHSYPFALLVIHLMLLASCSSPPKPPSVDEANKRPANVAMAVDLQACKSELHNTRIVATEWTRQAEAAAAALERAASHQQAMDAVRAVLTSAATTQNAAQSATQNSTHANTIFTLQFGFNSTRVAVPADSGAALLAAARNAPLVLLRGRTDGSTDTGAASRIARQRAIAVRDYLVAAGVDPSHIRTTHQATADHVADNSNATTKGMNRRVGIEVYRALPVAMNATQIATTATTPVTTPVTTP